LWIGNFKSIFFSNLFLQLPQSELDGLDPSYRKYRLENGESLAEKDEVSDGGIIISAEQLLKGSL
jgi:hypothetical protein